MYFTINQAQKGNFAMGFSLIFMIVSSMNKGDIISFTTKIKIHVIALGITYSVRNKN